MMTLARRPTAEGEEFEAHTGDVIYANAAGILHQESEGNAKVGVTAYPAVNPPASGKVRLNSSFG